MTQLVSGAASGKLRPEEVGDCVKCLSFFDAALDPVRL
jgi:hypothetical protein